jgi:PAS domain S-box-containing protein
MQMNPSGRAASGSVTHQRSRALRLSGLQHYGFALLWVGIALGASLLLEHFHCRVPATPLLLFAVAVTSWYGGTGPAVLAFLLSVIVFYWYFIEPVRTIYIYPSEIPFFITFVGFSALLSWFGTVRRRVEKGLRDQAELLNLTHDTVFVMDMEGVIKYWNRGAEELYGWNAEQAIGKVVHEVLKTAFPAPLEEIKAELTRTGRWEGELLHSKKDGTQVVAASRWALQRDRRGAPVGILETNNDITQRKRAEEELNRSNRELRAISSCNQILMRAPDEQSLLEEICRIICGEAGYRMAFVAYAEHDEAKTVRPVAWAGAEEGYLASAGITWADTERGRGPTGTAIRSSEICCVQDFAVDPRLAPWCESLLQRGFRSGIALPLKDEHGNTFGGLTIHSAEANAFTANEIALLKELAGDLAYGITTLRTRAKRQRAEEVLRVNDARYRTAEAVGHVGNWEYDVGTTMFWGSDEAKHLYGFDLGQVDFTTDEVESCIPERERVHQALVDLVEAGKPYNLEFEIRPRGSTAARIISSVAQLQRDVQGNPVKAVGIIRDVTESKRAEESIALLSFALDNVREVALLIDDTGRFRYVNEEGCRVLGYTRAELLSMGVSDIDPEFPAGRWSDHWRDLKEQRSLNFESRYRAGDGRVFPVEISANYFEYGGQAYNLALVRDITARKRAEEALRLSNAYNRSLIEASVDPLVTIGPNGKITDVNAATESATGRSRAELIGTDFCDYFTEPAKARAGYEQVFREGMLRDYPLELRHRNGRVMSVLYNASVYRDDSGQVIGVFAAARDITERKRTEEALRHSEAYLAEAQRLSHTGSWALDAASREYTYWSQEMFQIFGVKPQEGIPSRETMGRRIHPDDWKSALGGFEKSLCEKVDTSDEYRFVLPNGTVKHIQAIRHPVLNAAGDVFELVGSFMDVTERKRAEEALRESETRFRTFVDHAGDALFILDLEQRIIVDVNRAACESLGYTREELLATDPSAFHLDSDREHMDSIVQQATAGEPVFDRHWHQQKDGSTFPVEVHTNLVSHGGRRFLLKVARDISDRVRAEEQRERLRELEADLAHIDRVSMMGELAASIAHEVNQPLSGIVSNASATLRFLAADAPDLEEVREAVRDIARDGKRAGEVVARIRALTKRAAGPRERLDLNETIREVLALVGDEARRNSVIVRGQFADDLAPVAGDRVQLQQVVLNLVMNAIDAMRNVVDRERQLIVTTRNIGTDLVQVTVEDSGKGLDPKTMDKIFDSFYTTKPGGLGMGLSISRSILQAHGGRLWAVSNNGPGTVFHFTVPKYHEEEVHAGATRA